MKNRPFKQTWPERIKADQGLVESHPRASATGKNSDARSRRHCHTIGPGSETILSTRLGLGAFTVR